MGSWKIEKDMGAGGLPHLLRDLADALENGAGGDFSGMPEDARKLVLVAEARPGGGHRVKLKAKKAGELRVKGAADEQAGGTSAQDPRPGPHVTPDRSAKPAKDGDARERSREKYRQLKKLLQADYKALQKAAAAGQLPPQDVLESFLALGEAMAEAPQPGQPSQASAGPEAKELARANAAYLEDARGLRRAFSARDAASFAEILARLERRKSACHAQFK